MTLEDLNFWTPVVFVMVFMMFTIVFVGTCQKNDIKHLCFKVVQTELKNDPEIQDICKDVKITLGEINK